MSKIFITTGLITCYLISFSQRNTYVGIETALSKDIFEYADGRNEVGPLLLLGGFWGVNLRQEINDIVSIETGLIRKYYSEGFTIEPASFSFIVSNAGKSIDTWQIPLQIKTQLNIFNEKIFFTPNIGIHYCLNPDYNSFGWGTSTWTIGNESITTNYTSNPGLAKSFFLLESGSALEFVLSEDFLLSFAVNYMTGFRKLVQLDIDYTLNNGEARNAFAHSKGEYWSFGVAIHYRLGELLKKKRVD